MGEAEPGTRRCPGEVALGRETAEKRLCPFSLHSKLTVLPLFSGDHLTRGAFLPREVGNASVWDGAQYFIPFYPKDTESCLIQSFMRYSLWEEHMPTHTQKTNSGMREVSPKNLSLRYIDTDIAGERSAYLSKGGRGVGWSGDPCGKQVRGTFRPVDEPAVSDKLDTSDTTATSDTSDTSDTNLIGN